MPKSCDDSPMVPFGLAFGQNTDIRSRQAELAEAYGAFLPFVDTSGLRRLLSEARCLLVLDDVWTLPDLRAFDALPGGSAILVTTRHRGALFDKSTAIPVGPFKQSTSLQLISSLTGVTVGDLPGQAAEIAQLCGDLPLSIAIASGLVVSGSRWESVVERLRRGSLLTADSALRDLSLSKSLGGGRGKCQLTAPADGRYLPCAARLSKAMDQYPAMSFERCGPRFMATDGPGRSSPPTMRSPNSSGGHCSGGTRTGR